MAGSIWDRLYFLIEIFVNFGACDAVLGKEVKLTEIFYIEKIDFKEDIN